MEYETLISITVSQGRLMCAIEPFDLKFDLHLFLQTPSRDALEGASRGRRNRQSNVIPHVGKTHPKYFDRLAPGFFTVRQFAVRKKNLT